MHLVEQKLSRRNLTLFKSHPSEELRNGNLHCRFRDNHKNTKEKAAERPFHDVFSRTDSRWP